MGDYDTGLYVRDGIPDFIRDKAVPAADIITPNAFELQTLTGTKVTTTAEALAAARRLQALGPKTVLITSLMYEQAEPDSIEMLLVDDRGAWQVATPFLPIEPHPNGAGDTVAALFLGHILKGEPAEEAMSLSAAAIYGVMKATRAAGTRELRLIAAQDELVAPSRRFPATRLD
jgi:pyridoxine kinase